MNIPDYILIGLVALGCILAVRSIRLQKKRGGGCFGCSGCCDACSHRCPDGTSDQPKD